MAKLKTLQNFAKKCLKIGKKNDLQRLNYCKSFLYTKLIFTDRIKKINKVKE